MFSSNPFPEFPFSPNVYFPSNFLFDSEKDTACFNYHLNNNYPFISGACFPDHYNSFADPSPTIENITTITRDINTKQQDFSEEPVLESFQDHDGLLESVISFSEKKPRASNKDWHSKIYTARGPRDRRVRLSIDISRKFFCLQDMLGYDKASKTLDWLFTKCTAAIKELVEETNDCPSSTAYYQSKMSFLEAIMVGKDNSKKKSELKYDGKRKKMTQKPTGGFQDISTTDQSRAVARARARERVRETMRMNKLDELKTLVHDDFYYQNFKSTAAKNHWVTSADPAAWWSLTGSTS
ncbi:hypothetical protein L2E82_19091 [Cichorium intybus]|uniref:Uncharacterized protein n=1 Tax=Cichorium intybus TaxID=13427 RepID=A0ACB9FCB7_CICIN|nr:hypothetical protein L2E82_19091 [Cichorium intybus]